MEQYGRTKHRAGRIALLREYCAAGGHDAREIELSVHPQLAIGCSHAEAEART
jgi:alkanesulfonate monooxygenase SsuD/methylene tetrahydromethanopterin reductase-like flavin-dependent oxidoreductase (luciferase family)